MIKRSRLVLVTASLLLAGHNLLAAPSARADTSYAAVGLSSVVSGSSVSASVTISSTQTGTAARAGVCARSSSNANSDFPADLEVPLNPAGRTITHTRTLTPDSYTYWACVQNSSGQWFDVGAPRSFIVGAPSAPGQTCGLSIPGTHLAFEDSQSELDREMQLTAETGCQWVRFDVAAVQVETAPGVRNWGNIDRIVNSATDHGLRVVGTLSTLPAWSANWWQVGPTTAAQRSAFAAFAAAAAGRYAGRVDYWGVWNEPNSDTFWGGPSAAQYEALLQVTYPAIKGANPGATVMLGGTAGDQPNPNDTADWYRGLYAAGARPYFDVADLHPYPESAAAGPTSGEQGLIATVLSIMAAHGDAGKTLWGTETGIPTGGLNSTSENDQATMLTGLYDHWHSVGGSRVGPLFVYTLRDLPHAQGREASFGLIRNDFSVKPAYLALVARNH